MRRIPPSTVARSLSETRASWAPTRHDLRRDAARRLPVASVVLPAPVRPLCVCVVACGAGVGPRRGLWRVDGPPFQQRRRDTRTLRMSRAVFGLVLLGSRRPSVPGWIHANICCCAAGPCVWTAVASAPLEKPSVMFSVTSAQSLAMVSDAYSACNVSVRRKAGSSWLALSSRMAGVALLSRHALFSRHCRSHARRPLGCPDVE